MPTVSVIMPVYNAGEFLRSTIDSILAQTFTDFEFVIIDDGSTDSSLEILEEYTARDSRIRLISRPNTGYGIALNEMIELATGKYLARMDADDIAMPERFELQTAMLDADPKLVAVGSCVYMINESGQVVGQRDVPSDHEQIDAAHLSSNTVLTHPTAMIRADAMDRVGGYRTEMMPAEDLDLWLRLGEIGKLAIHPRRLLLYRDHVGSVSTLNKGRQLDSMYRSVASAYERRGIDRDPPRIKHWRPSDRTGKYAMYVRYAWSSFHLGQRRSMRSYGWRALATSPWGFEGWKVLVCSVVKGLPTPPTELDWYLASADGNDRGLPMNDTCTRSTKK